MFFALLNFAEFSCFTVARACENNTSVTQRVVKLDGLQCIWRHTAKIGS